MPPEIDTENKEDAEQNSENQSLPDAAAALIEEVRAGIKKEEVKTAPSSQPDQGAAIQAQREDFKKKMNFTEEQMQLYERDRLVSQAPLMRELALSKVERGHKDFDTLKKPFLDEVADFEKRGVIMNPELADQIFLMVKGRELEAGRYAPPSSQANDKKTPSSKSDAPILSRRVAAGYSGNDPGLSNTGGGGNAEEENALTDREKVYAKVLSVDAKEYAKMKEEKRQGIREIGDHSIRAPEIDMKTANPADRDLASLWGRNGGKI